MPLGLNSTGATRWTDNRRRDAPEQEWPGRRLIDWREVTTHAVSVVQPHVRRRGQLYVGLAALAWSTAGLLQRELSVDIPTQLAGRALFAFLALAALAALSNPSRTREA